jgi:hypothetical protein
MNGLPLSGVTAILTVSASLPRRASGFRARLLTVTENVAVPAFAVLVALPTRIRPRPLWPSADRLANSLTLIREPERATTIEPRTAGPRWMRASFS